MPYDEVLAERVRAVVRGLDSIEEQAMFGGLAFLWRERMFCGVIGNELMLRLGREGASAALMQHHVREMDFTGRPMRTMVFVEEAGLRTREQLGEWVERAVNHVRKLPAATGDVAGAARGGRSRKKRGSSGRG